MLDGSSRAPDGPRRHRMVQPGRRPSRGPGSEVGREVVALPRPGDRERPREPSTAVAEPAIGQRPSGTAGASTTSCAADELDVERSVPRPGRSPSGHHSQRGSGSRRRMLTVPDRMPSWSARPWWSASHGRVRGRTRPSSRCRPRTGRGPRAARVAAATPLRRSNRSRISLPAPKVGQQRRRPSAGRRAGRAAGPPGERDAPGSNSASATNAYQPGSPSHHGPRTSRDPRPDRRGDDRRQRVVREVAGQRRSSWPRMAHHDHSGCGTTPRPSSVISDQTSFGRRSGCRCSSISNSAQQTSSITLPYRSRRASRELGRVAEPAPLPGGFGHVPAQDVGRAFAGTRRRTSGTR